MARWGKCDFKQLENLAKKMDAAEKIADEIMVPILYEAANIALRRTKKRTPVGQYKDGRVGGTLRRTWHITNVQKKANVLYIEIYNNTEYASFVEHGHRTRNGGGKGWVEGRFMLTISMNEVEELLPTIADKHMRKAIRKLFEDGR